MNATLDHTRNTLCQILRIDFFSSWLVQPTGLSFTYEDYLGDTESDYAACAAGKVKITSETPQIDADEFEAEYAWFLS